MAVPTGDGVHGAQPLDVRVRRVEALSGSHMTRRRLRSTNNQRGQAIILVVLMIVALIAAVGLAVDGGIAYYNNTSAERAAAFAALSGVIFMPDQLTPATALPAGSGNDATDRAVAEARRNGFNTTSCSGTGPGTCTGPGGVN